MRIYCQRYRLVCDDRLSLGAVEPFNSLIKAKLVGNKGPRRGIDDVEFAVAEYIDGFNHRRLHGELSLVPPAEYEAAHAGSPTTPVGA